MRRLWTSIILFVGLGVYFLIAPTYKFKYYYYSKDSTRILTRVTTPNNLFEQNDTYLVPGFYDKHQLPATYVKPIPSSDGDWDEYVTFHSKGIHIIGHEAETKNLSDTFRFDCVTIREYAEALKIDSIEASLKDTQKVAVYSYKE